LIVPASCRAGDLQVICGGCWRWVSMPDLIASGRW